MRLKPCVHRRSGLVKVPKSQSDLGPSIVQEDRWRKIHNFESLWTRRRRKWVVDMKVDAWRQIWNSGYRALRRKAEDESVKVPKEISIIDRRGGRRTIDLVLFRKSQSSEENQCHGFGEDAWKKICHSREIHSGD